MASYPPKFMPAALLEVLWQPDVPHFDAIRGDTTVENLTAVVKSQVVVVGVEPYKSSSLLLLHEVNMVHEKNNAINMVSLNLILFIDIKGYNFLSKNRTIEIQ